MTLSAQSILAYENVIATLTMQRATPEPTEAERLANVLAGYRHEITEPDDPERADQYLADYLADHGVRVMEQENDR